MGLTTDQIAAFLGLHAKWLAGEESGSRANLRWANLSRANLSGANLSWANLSWANLSWANLSWANLSWANLSEANLSRADLSRANLSEANLSRADLSRANLSEANLSWANLSRANLSGANLSRADLSRANLSEADLSRADLSRANLSEADLRWADLSGATGLLNPIVWLADHLETDDAQRGLIAYKMFGLHYQAASGWDIHAGAVIGENAHPDRALNCACGISVAPRQWFGTQKPVGDLWRVLIRWPWLAGVVVPYNTDGKVRCQRVELLEIVT